VVYIINVVNYVIAIIPRVENVGVS